MAKIAILGYGTVGSGVYEAVVMNAATIAQKAGEEVEVKRILDLREFPGDPAEKLITHSIDDILNDDEITVVAEVMGGIEPAYTFVKQLLAKGKSVTTSNKELVALHGAELLALAKNNRANYLFEASVGGGIPIIRPLNSCLTADKIVEISGILNGTTNFILTKMTEQGRNFSDTLQKAQEMGYAEKNPEADVEGHDACRKLAILTSLATGKQIDFGDISTEGITHIAKSDIDFANKMNYVIKLLALSKIDDDGVFARVAPVMVKKSHPLATVNDVNNAIYIKGNIVGETMFYGSGAGKLPTGSAVIGDIIEAIRYGERGIPCLWSQEKQKLNSIGDSIVRKLVRVSYNDKQQILKDIKNIFNVVEIVELVDYPHELGFATREEKESGIEEKVARLVEQGNVVKLINQIRFY